MWVLRFGVGGDFKDLVFMFFLYLLSCGKVMRLFVFLWLVVSFVLFVIGVKILIIYNIGFVVCIVLV